MRIALAVLAILLICACATTRNDRPSLQGAVDSYFISSKSTDTALSESHLATEHIFIGPTGKLQDKAQRVAWLRQNSDWLPSVTTSDVVITDLGQTAIVTGIWLIPDGGKIVYERFMHVWQLRDSRWQMISHQVTEMTSPKRMEPQSNYAFKRTAEQALRSKQTIAPQPLNAALDVGKGHVSISYSTNDKRHSSLVN